MARRQLLTDEERQELPGIPPAGYLGAHRLLRRLPVGPGGRPVLLLVIASRPEVVDEVLAAAMPHAA